MRPRHAVLTVIAAVLMLISGCTGGTPTAKTGTATSSPSQSANISLGTATATASAGPDKFNPVYAGCNTDAVDVSGTPVKVYLDQAQKTVYGVLAVRHSPHCNTVWARVDSITVPRGQLNLSINRGKESSGYATSDAAPGVPAYTDMIPSIGAGCVFAEAFVNGGPAAKTACITG